MVRGADGVGELRGRQITSASQIAARDGRDGFSALGSVDLGAGGGDGLGREGFAVVTLAGCSCAACAGATAGLDGLRLGAEV